MSRRSIVIALAVAVIVVMTFAGLVMTVLLAAGGADNLAFGDRIAVLELEGLILDDDKLLEQLGRFRRDDSVRGFVLAINSPGGVVAPSQSLYRELRRLSREDERPVIASIGAVGASGGYYVALGADSILALPGSITGSIGVIMEFPNVSELMDRVGVQMEVVKSAEHKDIGSPFRPVTPEDRQILSAVVADVYDQFVEAVANERGLSREQVRAVADGRILSGRQALEWGLVDRLGNLRDAIDAAGRMAGLGEDPAIVRPPEERGFTLLDLLLGRGGSGVLTDWGRPLEWLGVPRLKFVVPSF